MGTVLDYRGRPIAESERADHHAFHPEAVYADSPNHRDIVLTMAEAKHNEYHRHFDRQCLGSKQVGAFLCRKCPREYLEVCGWGWEKLRPIYCTAPCNPECVFRYICIDKRFQLNFGFG